MTRHPTIAYARRAAAVQLVKWADSLREHRKSASAQMLGAEYIVEIETIEKMLRTRAHRLRAQNAAENLRPGKTTA